MDTLPNEIIEKIRNMVYVMNYQPKCLLRDISNYYKTRSIVLDFYHQLWIIDMNQPEPEDLFWLINDLRIYCNLKIKPRINIKSQINIWWGLLTVPERNQLVENLYN